jgi:hypothetical protein
MLNNHNKSLEIIVTQVGKGGFPEFARCYVVASPAYMNFLRIFLILKALDLKSHQEDFSIT